MKNFVFILFFGSIGFAQEVTDSEFSLTKFSILDFSVDDIFDDSKFQLSSDIYKLEKADLNEYLLYKDLDNSFRNSILSPTVFSCPSDIIFNDGRLDSADSLFQDRHKMKFQYDANTNMDFQDPSN